MVWALEELSVIPEVELKPEDDVLDELSVVEDVDDVDELDELSVVDDPAVVAVDWAAVPEVSAPVEESWMSVRPTPPVTKVAASMAPAVQALARFRARGVLMMLSLPAISASALADIVNSGGRACALPVDCPCGVCGFRVGALSRGAWGSGSGRARVSAGRSATLSSRAWSGRGGPLRRSDRREARSAIGLPLTLLAGYGTGLALALR